MLDQQFGDQALELAHQFLARQADRGREVDAAHHQGLHGAARLVDLAARQLAGRLGLGRLDRPRLQRQHGRRRACGGRSDRSGVGTAPAAAAGTGAGAASAGAGSAAATAGWAKLVAGSTGRSTSAT